MFRQAKVNRVDKKQIPLLIHKLKTGQATDRDKQMLEEYWDSAISDTLFLDEMSSASVEKLKNEMFHAIQVRLGLNK